MYYTVDGGKSRPGGFDPGDGVRDFLVPPHSGLLNHETPFADFIAKTGGERLRQVINLGVAASIFNALLACIIGWTRVFYSTGRDRLFPEGISRFLVRVHSRFHSPWGAALLLGAISMAACALALKQAC